MKLSPGILASRIGVLAVVCHAGICSAAPTLLVGSRDTNSVLVFDAATGQFLRTLVLPDTAGLNHPIGLALAPSGNLLVTSGTGDNVLEFHPETGELARVFLANVNGPSALVDGPNGNLFVSLGAGDSVLEVDPVSGEIVSVFVEPPAEGRTPYTGLTFGPDGNLYVSALIQDAVVAFDGTTGAPLGTFTGESTLDGPFGLLFRENGNLLVASSSTGNVKEFDATTGEFVSNFAGAGGLIGPWDMTFTPWGTLLVADSTHDDVLEYDAETGAFIRELIPRRSGGLEFPTGLLLIPDDAVSDCATPCGDFNRDLSIDLYDFSKFSFCMGRTPTVSQTCQCTDLNADGRNNLLDFATFAVLFGLPAPFASPPFCLP